MASRFLKIFTIPVKATFEVEKPEKKPSFNTKLGWTFTALVLYLIMLKVRVYGYVSDGSTDPFAALRVILASQRGSLAELGIGPIVTSGMILQLLVGSKIISVNFEDSEERALYTGTQKVLAILMTFFEAIAYISGGAYGDSVQNDPVAKTMIVIQLVIAGMMIMLLDEIVQKGYGLGSGISLFIATSVSFTIFNGVFSLQDAEYPIGSGEQWKQGALIFFIQSIARGTLLKGYGLYSPDFRGHDMFNLLATAIIFAVVIYAESMRIEIPVQHSEHRIPARYPIKFMYVSNIPVILVSALFANIYLISNLLNNRYANDTGVGGSIAKLFGVWNSDTQQPESGLAYYTTPPRGLDNVFAFPFRAFMYFIIMTVFSTIFAMVWVETAGMSSRDVAKQLIGADMQIPGFRRHPKIIERYLNNYIPYAAFLGGMLVGVLASMADFMGAIGSGTGILLTTGIIKQYYEILVKERLSDINPALANILGITG